MAFIDEIKKMYQNGSIIIRLIFVNVAVFVLVGILGLLSLVVDFETVRWLAVPADLKVLLYRPWTIISYMFLHYDFMHILFNMLWLFWFGKIFLEFLSSKQLLNVYLLGGISGAILYILAFNTIPAFRPMVPGSVALGASASVYAIVVAISAFAPNYSINLMFIGRVKIKYVAIFVIALDVLSIAGSNAGGHIAHLGGAMFGYLFAVQFKKGSDITKLFSNFIDGLAEWFQKKPKMKVTENKYKARQKPSTDREYNQQKAGDQSEMDRILGKISESGYDSLTKKEKETLFNYSKKK
ncbi:MAG: rhomboid family intramembrane serine protease [Bacteroidetes bacterium]|nr:MAG: rhomboid family intramembrane serine protease [Bacteroidota bacterium]